MKINTELINKTLETLKIDLLEICTKDEIKLEVFEQKIDSIKQSIDTLDTLSIFIDDKEFVNEFMAYSLVGNRLINNRLDILENKELRFSLVDSLHNMGVDFDLNPSNNLIADKLKVEDVETKKESKLSSIKKEMTSKEKVDLMVEEANYKIMTYFKNSNSMKEYLNYMAKFYNYSLRNLALIEEQFSGAKAVGSFKFWSDKGYKINKGEKGIKILTPTKVTYLILGDGKEKQLKFATKEEKEKVKKGLIETREKIFYKTGYVFDISQTNAKASDLPEIFPNKWLEGDVKDYDKLYKSMEEIAKSIGVSIVEPKGELGVAKGCFYPMTNEVALNPRNSEIQNVKTLLHELAHAKLHTLDKRNDYSIQEREYQAEMVAYTTCSYFGIDTSDYSLDYMYNWTKNMDLDECIEIIKEVKETSAEYIEKIENYMLKNMDITLDLEISNEEEVDNELLIDKIENIYVKFISSDYESINEGDIYNFEVANDLVDILSERYSDSDISMYTKFELHTDEKCTSKFYEGAINIGDGLDYDLKNHMFKVVKNGEIDIDDNNKSNLIDIFKPSFEKAIDNEIYVKFVYSEHHKIEDNSIFKYKDGDKLLEILTEMSKLDNTVGYYKTKFEIYDNIDCQGKPFYTGRFDIGDGYAKNLSNHIDKFVNTKSNKIEPNVKNSLFRVLGISSEYNNKIIEKSIEL